MGELSTSPLWSENFLKFGGGFTAPIHRQIGDAPNVDGIQRSGPIIIGPPAPSSLGIVTLEDAGVRRRAEHLYQQLDILQPLRQQARRELLAESRKHSTTVGPPAFIDSKSPLPTTANSATLKSSRSSRRCYRLSRLPPPNAARRETVFLWCP